MDTNSVKKQAEIINRVAGFLILSFVVGGICFIFAAAAALLRYAIGG